MPLPPYIKREKGADPRDSSDRERYQTVYAKSEGSVAAPTAGLHFTDELLASLDGAGIQRATVTLDVSLGTFKPVIAESLDQHAMHVETYSIPASTADALNRAKASGQRIIAVGTTSARVLESQPGDEPAAIQVEACQRIDHQLPFAAQHADRPGGGIRRFGGAAAGLSNRDPAALSLLQLRRRHVH